MHFDGRELPQHEIIVTGSGVPIHFRSSGACHWGSMSLTLEDLAAAAQAVAGRDFIAPFFHAVHQTASGLPCPAVVLEAYAGKSIYAQHGERVVQGQRLMQPASDLFLGWVISPEGRYFYIRQLRDVKLSLLVETYDAEMLSIYGKACGWALARAHAKAGEPWTISGYLGTGGQFDDAMGKFALAYADQAEKDHAALKAAVRPGIVEVPLEH
jgi:Uncharacterized protein conserved in bacteria (DUF2252)